MAPRKRARSAAADGPPDVSLRSLCEPDQLHQRLARQWRDGRFCDIEVIVAGRSFHAHRCVLAASSDFMGTLMNGSFADSAAPSITLSDVDPTIFEAALTFCYEGVCLVAHDALEDALQLAARLQILELRVSVATALQERLGASSCLSVWSLAEVHALPTLAAAACAAAARNFDAIAFAPAFSSVPANNLSALLREPELEADECIIFRAVVAWLRAQPEAARAPEAVAKVMADVRFGLLPLEVLRSDVDSEPLLQNFPVQKVLSEQMRDKAHNLGTTCTFSRRRLGWDAAGGRPGVTVSGNRISFGVGTHLVPFGPAVTKGKTEYQLKLVAGFPDNDEASSGFGFVDAEITCTDCDDFSFGRDGLWWLRRYESRVYREEEEFTQQHAISLDVGAAVRMVLDMDAGEATFFIDGQELPTKATRIDRPVRPCAGAYALEDGDPKVVIEYLR